MNTNRNDQPQNNLGAQGGKDTLKGRANKLGGRIEEKIGEWTGNREMQARGRARRIGGSLQSGAGDIERKL
jgi:uncharacterized protein YjbJ (UPF0337 family)